MLSKLVGKYRIQNTLWNAPSQKMLGFILHFCTLSPNNLRIHPSSVEHVSFSIAPDQKMKIILN